jgi:hypothetical protein
MKYRILFLLITTAMIALASWRVVVVHKALIPQFGVVEDSSLSHQVGCSTWLGIAEDIINSNDARPGSDVIYFALGDRRTSDEPREVLDALIPVSQRAIQSESSRRRKDKEFLSLIEKRCEETEHVDRSPIFLAIKQALFALKTKGCKPGSKCRLIVDSDLEENEDRPMANAIAGRPIPESSLPARLDNDGIVVEFCGLAETFGARTDSPGHEHHLSGPHDPGYEDRLRSIWLSRFGSPELVTFSPYCHSESE